VSIKQSKIKKILADTGTFLYNDRKYTISTFVSLYCQGNHLLVLCLDTSPHRPCRLMAPVYILGPFRCVFFVFIGTVQFSVVLLCSCRRHLCPGCIHLVVATFGCFFCSSAAFQTWSISRILG